MPKAGSGHGLGVYRRDRNVEHMLHPKTRLWWGPLDELCVWWLWTVSDLELVHGYHKEYGVPKASIKVDIQKTYDMVEWDRIWLVLEAMSFPAKFIFLIQRCVMSASFLVNGDLQWNDEGNLPRIRVYVE